MNHFIGNLFDYFDYGVHGISCDAIAHVCNCQGVMGSGIAKAIKERYPQAFKAYKDAEKRMKVIPAYQGLQLGTVSEARFATSQGYKLVLNLHAQDFYGTNGKRYLNYEAMYKCLIEAKHWLNFYDTKILGVPYKMGCDRAGGDWGVVKAMLESVFANSGITVFSVEL